MKNVTVEKAELVRILQKNRKEHRDIFLAAQKRYREKAIQVLDEQLNLARKGDPFVLARITSLIAPVDYTREYDRAIAMLNMEVNKQVTLDRQDFCKFVQDDWEWSRQWATSNAHYTTSPKFDPYLGDVD